MNSESALRDNKNMSYAINHTLKNCLGKRRCVLLDRDLLIFRGKVLLHLCYRLVIENYLFGATTTLINV